MDLSASLPYFPIPRRLAGLRIRLGFDNPPLANLLQQPSRPRTRRKAQIGPLLLTITPRIKRRVNLPQGAKETRLFFFKKKIPTYPTPT